MSEFIGSRISLISKSDIKYVGTLHEINSETSTVALENVRSFGTEGRRGNPDEEIGPNDQIYDYIVFRGSDVKDLTIVEAPKDNKPPPQPQMPNDPAILGAARPHPGAPQAPGAAPQSTQPPFQQPPPGQQWRGPQPPQFPPYGYPPPPQQNGRFAPGAGPHGFPQGPGAPPGYGMQYGPPPPGWFPPGQGFPGAPPGPFPSQPIGPPGLQNQQNPSAPAAHQPTPSHEDARPAPADANPSPSVQPTTAGPPPPNESKPDVSAATAPAQQSHPKVAPTGPRNNRVAVPLASPNVRSQPQPAPLQSKPGNSQPTAANPAAQNATQAAAAAVAAAMAKLGPVQGSRPDAGVDNLTKKVGEMRTDDRIRNSRQPGTGGFATGHRGGRGGRRPSTQQNKPVEVPATDFDFEASNAKFDKQDLVKEAIATGDPMGTANGDHGANATDGNEADLGATHDDVEIPKATYNKSTSFFDNISSELKDRKAAQEEGKRMGGVEHRSQERSRNFETFGQGSVDTGFGGRGRGRGRGRGFGRGRGGFSEGRGGYAPRGNISRGRGGIGSTGVNSQNAATFG